MQAVIDYHAASGGKVSRPDRCRHTAAHDFPFSVPWQRWREIDGQLMTQSELGLFLEEMLYTIAAPAGAGLLELASELRIDRQVKFKSGTRLQSGANSLAYEEEDETSGRSGKMEVPDAVTIACPVFMGGARRPFEAKLRYRLNRGDIKFAFAVINRLEGEQAAFEGKRSAAVPVNGGEPAGEGKRSAAVPQERRGNPPGASTATPCPEGRQSRPGTAGKPAGGGKKRDLDNILKALLDLLTSTRTIGDDSQVVAIDARWVDDGPACRMTVRAVGPGGCRS